MAGGAGADAAKSPGASGVPREVTTGANADGVDRLPRGGAGGGSANARSVAVAGGAVRIEVNQKYALKDAVQAHIDLESRKTTGSTVLIP